MGVGTIGSFLSKISKASGLSYIYTNHCIQGTTATVLKRSGHTLEEIAHVLKHKNLESLKHYLDAPTLKDKENYSTSLFKDTNKDNTDDHSGMEDFELLPPPLKKKGKNQKLNKQTKQQQVLQLRMTWTKTLIQWLWWKLLTTT